MRPNLALIIRKYVMKDFITEDYYQKCRVMMERGMGGYDNPVLTYIWM